MQEILRAKYSRKAFITISVVGVILLLLLSYVIFPFLITNSTWKKNLVDLSNGINFSFISTIFIGLFIYFFTPKIMSESAIEIAEARQLGELFDEAFPTTKRWWYTGGCGRYFRTKTLPEMVKRTRTDSHHREIKVIILDPQDKDLCQAHANYRSSTASAKLEQEVWTINKVQNELYATIVTTLILKMQNHLLSVDLSLASRFSTFRLDLSDKYVIVTKEDRKAPAIKCSSKSYYYESYKAEILIIEKQSKPVKQIRNNTCKLGNLNKEDIKNILLEVELFDPPLIEEDLEKIAKICNEGENPYA